MRKVVRIISWSVLGLLLLVVLTLLLARFVFNKQLTAYLSDAMRKEKVQLLRDAGKYEADTPAYHFIYLQDTAQAGRIRGYFQLDTIVKPTEPTWDRARKLARFVAGHIPHANQKISPEKRDAIGLWEYTRTVEPAFNCRMHSILLHELLLPEGIQNRFVTCFPEDSLDTDCHMVNMVWLPEMQKWAMLDSDMMAWAEDENGTPLSLSEMRERYIHGKEIVFRPLLDSEGDFKYYRAYWAKNLYWFDCWETTGYGREDNNPIFGNQMRHVALIPKGFTPFKLHEQTVLTTDSARFWASPDSLTALH